MRLVDLLPRWIHPQIFVFLCPHCQAVFLSCKSVAMSIREQCEVFEKDPIGEHGVTAVLCKASCAWAIEGTDFETMTVTPSLDASAAGHWHGFISGGMITP
jgi:hypothetical protein